MLPALAVLLVSLPSIMAEDFDFRPGIHFDDSQKIDVQGVLQIYKPLSGFELVIDSHAAKVVTPITYGVPNTKSFSRDEAIKLMEKTLLEEAGIVFTHLDDKRVSVTYNDALPIKKQKS